MFKFEGEIQETAEKKDEAFVISSSIDFAEYKKIQSRIDSLAKKSKDINGQAESFVELWGDVLTAPREAETKEIPRFILLEMFEKSFEYFATVVSKKSKEDLVELQMNFLAKAEGNEEISNACQGMWGYYFNPEKFYAKDQFGADSGAVSEKDLKTAEEFRRMVLCLVDEESKKPAEKRNKKLLNYAALANDRNNLQPESESMNYFAKLYAGDVRPLVPEVEVIEHRRTAGQEGGSVESGEGGEKRSPHLRLYTFGNDRLPRPKTLALGAADLYLTPSELDLQRGEEADIVLDKLPIPLMMIYVERMSEVRSRQDYRSLDPIQKRKEREAALKLFIDDLENFSSSVWQQLENELTLDEAEDLKKTLARYKKRGHKVHLGVGININKED